MPCALCKKDYTMPHMHDLKGRLFCDTCFATVNAKLRERGLAVETPPPAAPPAPAPEPVEATRPLVARTSSAKERGSAPGFGWARARPSGVAGEPAAPATPVPEPITAVKAEGTAPLSPLPPFSSFSFFSPSHFLFPLEQGPCSMCKNNFPISQFRDIKGRNFCPDCFGRVLSLRFLPSSFSPLLTSITFLVHGPSRSQKETARRPEEIKSPIGTCNLLSRV